MYKSIILFAIVFYSCLVTAQNTPELSANKQALIKQAKIWIAEQVKLEPDQVEISATDRSYQNNVEVINTARQLMLRTLEITKI